MAKLPPADADRFFRLYRTLQLDANERLHALPAVRTGADLADAPLEDQVTLRDALYDHPELIERFVADNPAGLAAADLAEVASWARFVRGDFYLLRHLKRYSVFLSSGSPARAYGVLGLSDDIAAMFPPYALPVYLTTVLLPFRGQIVWDGLVRYSNVTFGPGIRADLNETYQRAKQRAGIVAALAAPDQATAAPAATSRPRKAHPDLRPLIQGIVAAAEQLRPGETALQGRAYGLLRAAAHLAEIATTDPADRRALGERLRALARAYKQLATAYARDVDPEDE